MGVFGRSWNLAKISFRMVREEKELIVFPILSFVFSLLLILVFAVPYILSAIIDAFSSFAGWSFLHYFIVGLIYFGLAFIATFFNVCVVYTAATKFSNEDPKFWNTIKYAFSKTHLIAAWSVVSATVGLLLLLLENIAKKVKGVGGIFILVLRSLLGAAWSIATIFVVPVMVYKGLGPFAAIKESVSTLKKTWGEKLVGSVGMGMATFVFILVGFIVAVGMGFLLFPLGIPYLFVVIVLFVIYFVMVIIFFGVAQKIYDTALYSYAQTGVVVGGFSEEDLKNAFKIEA